MHLHWNYCLAICEWINTEVRKPALSMCVAALAVSLAICEELSGRPGPGAGKAFSPAATWNKMCLLCVAVNSFAVWIMRSHSRQMIALSSQQNNTAGASCRKTVQSREQASPLEQPLRIRKGAQVRKRREAHRGEDAKSAVRAAVPVSV